MYFRIYRRPFLYQIEGKLGQNGQIWTKLTCFFTFNSNKIQNIKGNILILLISIVFMGSYIKSQKLIYSGHIKVKGQGHLGVKLVILQSNWTIYCCFLVVVCIKSHFHGTNCSDSLRKPPCMLNESYAPIIGHIRGQRSRSLGSKWPFLMVNSPIWHCFGYIYA